MADVFLSYKREDRTRARAVVEALQASGRSVWWDEGLTPREAWDAKIEREIGLARKVIVLWSQRSVASEWVRSEAHYAQSRGKLVPVLIEPCTVPLAFMLRQAVDLSDWHASTLDPAWLKLLGWLDSEDPAPESMPAPSGSRQPLPPPKRVVTFVMAAVLAVVLATGLLALRSRSNHSATLSLRVAPFDTVPGDAVAASFSQGYAADLAQIVVSGGSTLRVVDGTNPAAPASNADFALSGAVRSDAGVLRATLTLNSAADGAIIWSTSLARPVAEATAMHHEAAVRMGAVFVCALDESTRDRSIVSLDALKAYLQACEALPSGDDLRTRKILRDVTRLAPNFAQGWATLAEWNGFIVGRSDVVDEEGLLAARAEALDAASRALALDPKNSGAWVARGMIKTKISEWTAAQADLARALELNPDDPIGNYFFASNLINVGRTNEALDYALRAASSGPRFWPKDLMVINVFADINRIDEAQERLAAALRIWPDNDALRDFRATLAARYADPRKSLLVLDDPGLAALVGPKHLEILRLEAAARANPSSTATDAAARAIAALLVGPDQAYEAADNYMVIGRVSDAYASIAAMPTPLAKAPYLNNPAPLFSPYAAAFRKDPRFMKLAARLGLVAVWQATKWPDFCAPATAPFDCRATAAMAATEVATQ